MQKEKSHILSSETMQLPLAIYFDKILQDFVDNKLDFEKIKMKILNLGDFIEICCDAEIQDSYLVFQKIVSTLNEKDFYETAKIYCLQNNFLKNEK